MAKKSTPTKAAAKKTAAKLQKPLPKAKAKSAPPQKVAKPPARPAVKTAAKTPPKAAAKRPAAPVPEPPAPAVVQPAPQVTAAALPPPPLASLPKTVPLNVSVQSAQGMAANGNTHPANLLVIVTSDGWPVTELDKNHFTLMEHFEVPGQVAPFSNSITSFRNAGTGAYLIQTKPINGAPWKSGHHLGQLLVSNSEDQQGQAAFKLIIR